MTVMGENGDVSEKERVKIASEFILHAPPGEFNEVFNDVRVLLKDDRALKEGCASAFAQYTKEQLLAVPLPGHTIPVLLTSHNDLGGGRFFDPRSSQAFRYDHLRREASDLTPMGPPAPGAEALRKAMQAQADEYVQSHYQITDKTGSAAGVGTAAVFAVEEAGKPRLTLAFMSNKLESKNYSNGRWRSEWNLRLTGDKTAELTGTIRVQVHYYEDGNVQLVSAKEITRSVSIGSDSDTARAVLKIIKEEEDNYQLSAKERYENMSKSTLKTLRRPLPMTKSLMDWTKAVGQGRVLNELKPI